jgi:hypothetical protein
MYFVYTQIIVLRHVKTEPPPLFPILVITPVQNQGNVSVGVLHWRDMSEFKKKNKDFSFIVNEGEKTKIKKLLDKHILEKNRNTDSSCSQALPSHVDFWLIKINNTKQILKVNAHYCMGFNSYGSWYMAEKKKIYPLIYCKDIDTVGIEFSIVMFYSPVVTICIFVAGILLKRRKRLGKNRATVT